MEEATLVVIFSSFYLYETSRLHRHPQAASASPVEKLAQANLKLGVTPEPKLSTPMDPCRKYLAGSYEILSLIRFAENSEAFIEEEVVPRTGQDGWYGDLRVSYGEEWK